jgi:hypothetical protein
MKTGIWAVGIFVLSFACGVWADGTQGDPNWLPGDGVPGTNGTVYCTTHGTPMEPGLCLRCLW